jgi:hypothetical protein
VKNDMIAGNYKKDGNRLLNKDTELLIKSRKPVYNKPLKYLVRLAGDKENYISSLYKENENVYNFDVKLGKIKIKYMLIINDTQAVIKQVNTA